MDTKTPLSYQRFKSRPTNRQLWPQDEVRENLLEKWIRWNSTPIDPWDKIKSPQFTNFFNATEYSDRFFETREEEKPLEHCAAARKLPTTRDHNKLIELLNDCSLTKVKKENFDENIVKDKEYKEKEEQTLSKIVRFKCIETKDGITNEIKKNKSEKWHTTLKPFSFDLRDKSKQEKKEEYIKKILNEEKNVKVFRAQPLPKFVKTSVPSNSGCTSRSIKSEQLDSNNKKDKSNKKSTEIWKKTPFIPRRAKRMLPIPKTPILLTAARAEKRKQFEQTLRKKEEEMEMRKIMTAIAEKKLLNEEIIRSRKAAVHKAQPIRKYKSSLPQIVKRPLTEPLTPFNHKRRRCT